MLWSIDVNLAEPRRNCCDVGAFNIRMEDNHMRFEMKQHYATVEAAIEAVEPYI